MTSTQEGYRRASSHSPVSPVFARCTEPTREREVFRYLRPWIDSFQDTVIPHVDLASATDRSPIGCNDTALAAFAQLGALRLDAQRCFISLLSSSTEYVLAESTRTLSLQYDATHAKRDGLCLGTAAFPREEAIAHLAIDDWRRAKFAREVPPSDAYSYTQGQSGHWLIVSDVSSEDRLQELPYVLGTGRTSLRFLCAVPIRSKLGSVVGAYCVIDSKPRYSVSADDMSFLEDMSSTVVNHLESIATTARQGRAERLIQGIALFNTGQDTLRHWWLTQDSEKNSRARDGQQTTRLAQMGRLDHELGPEISPTDYERNPSRPSSRSPDRGSVAQHAVPPPAVVRTTSSKDFGAAVGFQKKLDGKETQEEQSRISPEDPIDGPPPDEPESAGSQSPPPPMGQTEKKHFGLQDEAKQAYSRASNLIRESLGAEGVLFLDASMSHTSEAKSNAAAERSAPTSTSGSENNTSDTENDSAESSSGSMPSSKCSVLGFSTRAKSSLKGFVASKNHLGLAKSFQRRLIRQYPNGVIFNFAETGSVYSSSGEEGSSGSAVDPSESTRKRKPIRSRTAKDGMALSRFFNGASSILFLPSWNVASQRFRATALVWVTTPLRHFQHSEDMTYLHAFSSNIMAEIARLETIAADNAKATFISSVSHELRSPLHGVLGGIEFLEETNLDEFQRDMARAVKMAGTTLLDTVDNILDYVKIDDSAQSQRRRQHVTLESNSSDGVNDEVLMDLGKLTEDVVESVVTGRRFETMTKEFQSSSEPGSGQDDARQPVSIFLTIPSRDHWWIKSSPGTWTRILTNIVGNALKYTPKGFVHISISVGASTHVTPELEHRPVVFTIQDTGLGMSQEFIDSGLFAPFQQEDSNAKGTGLGMSIVKAILAKVDGGKIRVSSEVGKGTRVRISHVAKFVTKPSSNDDCEDHVALALDVIQQGHLCLFTGKEQADGHTAELRSALIEVCRKSLDVDPSLGSFARSESRGNFNMAVDRDLFAQDQVSLRALSQEAHPTHRLIVIGSSVYEDTSHRAKQATESSIVYISQPIGPSKIARAILQSMEPSHHSYDMPAINPNPLYGVYSRQNSTSTTSNTSRALAPSVLDPHQPLSDPNLSGVTPSSPEAGTNVLKREFVRSPDASPVTEQRSKHVLLVEDNEINMKLLVALIKKLKLGYSCAENGLVAVQKYTANPSLFDLILMDISMPVMDGFRATERIRTHERKNKLNGCAIVALTGVTSEQARKDAFSSGVNDFMAKPISMKQISGIIDSI